MISFQKKFAAYFPRTPFIQTIEDFPIQVGFMPSWWHKNYGINFGKDYYFNPEYRLKIDMEAERLLYERFRYSGLGKKDPSPNPRLDFGDVVIPAIFGMEIAYSVDATPKVIPNYMDEADDVKNLKVPDIECTPPIREVLRQADFLKKRYGMDLSLVDCAGVLSNALRIRSEALLIDFYERPSLAKNILGIVTKTMLDVLAFFRKRFKQKFNLGVSNCSIIIISPGQYKEFLFPYDLIIAQETEEFRIHHCGIIDKYLSEYQKFGNLTSMDIGWGSDIKLVRNLFPHTDLRLIVSPSFIKDVKENEITVKIKNILTESIYSEKTIIWISDIEYDTPDINIITAIKVAKNWFLKKA